MQNAEIPKIDYELKKVILAEQERLEASKRELNEVKVIADEETIAPRNQQSSKFIRRTCTYRTVNISIQKRKEISLQSTLNNTGLHDISC
jgi:hypothetical protein